MKSKVFADYHTHTIYSHGTGTVEENAAAAYECGLSELGISDHGFRQIAHGITKKGLLKQLEDIKDVREKFPDMQLFASIEANIVGTDGAIDLTEEWFEKLDYVIAGYHRTAVPWQFRDLFRLQIPGIIAPKSAKKWMTQADVFAARNAGLKFISHPGEYIPIEMEDFAEAAKDSGLLIEINNKHPMSKQDIQIAMNHDCLFVLSSDAHKPENVGNVERAYDAVMSAGVPAEKIVNLRRDENV